MKITVLLAACNGGAFLPAQLDSLRKQTDPDFEVLLQDDGSTDNTPEILAETIRRDSRFHAGSESGRHLGAQGNFLSLLRQTDADACLLCDQDDWWEKVKIAVLRQTMTEAIARYGSQTPILVHSDASMIDAEGRPLAPSFFRHQGWDPAAVTLSRLIVQNNVTGCTAMLNRPLIDLVNQTARTEKLFMHDWWIALTAAAFGHVLFVDQPLVRYRQHGKNAIGASTGGQLSRGVDAVRGREKARQRIALTYTHTAAFREQCGSLLPAEADQLLAAYLATRSLPRIPRILRVFRLGCTMQSPITRLGQVFFG